MKLKYEVANAYVSSGSYFNGNISSMEWNTGNSCAVNGTARNKSLYGFTYDGLNRLTQSKYGEVDGTTAADRYNEILSYNLNGDITTLTRYGKNGGTQTAPTFGLIDNLAYIMSATGSSMLSSVTDASSMAYGFVATTGTSQAYAYDNNGNLTTRSNTKYNNITYNHLNLPHTISGTGGTISNVYDAAGTKWQSTVGGVITTYFGGLEYEGNALKAIYHEDGRIEKTGTTYEYQYYIKDHLGNVRVVFKSGPTLIAEHHYYPYGMNMEGNYYLSGYNQKYRYNGKELVGSDLNWYHYGARWYDPCIARFTTIDPLTDKYNFRSGYVYAADNPVMNIDFKGMAPKGKESDEEMEKFERQKQAVGLSRGKKNPDGRGPDWIYDQQKDGSYKRREGVANDGGANFHTYVNRDGTTHYYNQKENTFVTVKQSDAQKKLDNYQKAVEQRRDFVKKTGEVTNNVGDGIAAVGYAFAPFTDGVSLGIAAIGEGIALGGKVITNAVNFEESGMTKDNFTNLGVDVALELAPKPLENALKKANLDQIVRNTDPTPITNMVQSSIGKVKLTTDYVVKKQLEENK